MAKEIDVSKLHGIFQMISNVSERVKFHYGTPPDDVVNFLLRAMIAPPAIGALRATELLNYVKQLPKPSETNVVGDRVVSFNSQQLRFSSTVDNNPPKKNDVENPRILLARTTPDKGKESDEEFKSITMLDALNVSQEGSFKSCPVSFILSTMPFLNPAVGRASDAEMFLNFMPSYVVSRMVPYVDVEFQFTRPYDERSKVLPSKLSTPGLLKFLNGALQFNLSAQNANDVMALGHRILKQGDSETSVALDGTITNRNLERSYAGMELFTSPQTLINPEQLDPSLRYKEILDPFRPLMSLTSLSINVAPTVGYFSNKTATVTIKLHDRSRLTEIGDLLQPEIYTRTILWLTYGWMHPNEPENPYAAFINNNMLARELYGIHNASYVFENDGQVTITLQLHTLGATEMMDIKISAGQTKSADRSIESIDMQLKAVIQQITYIANKMGLLNNSSGGTADIRAYQIVNSAVGGTFPQLDKEDVTKAIATLTNKLKSNVNIDSQDVTDLQTALNKMYKVTGDGKDKKYDIDVRRSQAVDSLINERFKMLSQNDTDPWIPWIIKGLAGQGKRSPYANNTFADEIEKYFKNLKVSSTSSGKNAAPISGVCSFAKIIATFVAPQIAEAQICDEFQVFFYAFNESAALAAGQCIANFPIDLAMFREQYALYTTQIGTSRMPIAQFLKFVIDSQLHDYRSLGYGTRAFFKKFDPKENHTLKEDAQTKQAYEDFMTKNQSKYGPFHLPTIEAYLEAVPLVSSSSDVVDLMADVVLDRSAKEAQGATTRKFLKNRYALRLHIYDKQLNPYKDVESAIKPPSGKPGHIILVSDNADVKEYVKSRSGNSAFVELLRRAAKNDPTGVSAQQEILLDAQAQGVVIPMDLSSNRKIKDYISSIVPTIIVGCNGSVVKSAQLSTSQDSLLSATQMMKQSGRVNPQDPSGAGPGGMPITVIPGQLSMTTLGCPLFQLTQKYFVDFNTGTTADNIYCVNKLSHNFSPGKFETTATFVWADAYGRIAGASDVDKYLTYIKNSLTPPMDDTKKNNNKKK